MIILGLKRIEIAALSVPKMYDTYLTTAYGDYMKLPPEDDRKTHMIECLDFGNYTFD